MWEVDCLTLYSILPKNNCAFYIWGLLCIFFFFSVSHLVLREIELTSSLPPAILTGWKVHMQQSFFHLVPRGIKKGSLLLMPKIFCLFCLLECSDLLLISLKDNSWWAWETILNARNWLHTRLNALPVILLLQSLIWYSTFNLGKWMRIHLGHSAWLFSYNEETLVFGMSLWEQKLICFSNCSKKGQFSCYWETSFRKGELFFLLRSALCHDLSSVVFFFFSFSFSPSKKQTNKLNQRLVVVS